MILVLQDVEAAESSDVNAAASTDVTVEVPSEETRIEANTGWYLR